MKNLIQLSKPVLRAAVRLTAVLAFGWATVQSSQGQTLTHRYSMDDATVTDSIGAANGTPVNNVGYGNIVFTNGAAVFPGSGDAAQCSYISLPAGLITGYTSLSVELWATIQPNGNWNEICVFGEQDGGGGGLDYVLVVPHSGVGDYRMSIKTLGNERATGGATPLDTSTPVHITAVWDATQSEEFLYANGVLVSSTPTTIDINNINNVVSWLGRGLFDGDASFKGSIDEVRIWNGALTPLQISINDGLGANVVNTNAGAFVNLASVSVPNATVAVGANEQATAFATFANVANVPLNSQVTNWVSSNPSVLTVSGSGLVNSVGPLGSATISATALGSTASVLISVSSQVQPTISQDLVPLTKFVGSPAALTFGANGGNLHYYWYRNSTLLPSQTNSTLNIAAVALSDDANYGVTASNAIGTVTSSTVHLTVLQQALTHRYSMDDATVTDSVGGANGTPTTGNVTFSGGQAHFPGDGGNVNIPNGDYINLPTGLITGYNSVSMEFWATITNSGNGWRWLAGFGNQNTRLIFVPESGGNDSRMTIQTGGNERVAGGAPRIDTGVPVHIVAVWNADQNLEQLYENGVLVATDSTTIDLNNISDDLNVLGRGFYGDPNPPCAIDEFRIWNGPLTPQQVSADFALGPNVVTTNAGGAFLGLSSVSVPSTTMVGNSSQQATALAAFANASNVPLNSDITNWVSSNPSVLTVSSSGLVHSVGPIGSATISATAFGSTATSALISVSSAQPTISQDLVPVTKFVGSPPGLMFGALGGNLHYYWYRNSTLLPSQTNATLNIAAVALSDDANYYVTASNAVGTVTSSTVHLTVLQQALTHRYSMDDATVTDSIGGANGTPTTGNVTFSGGQAHFPGDGGNVNIPNGDYINLPTGLITGYNSVTFEMWCTVTNTGDGWRWLAGFGNQNTRLIFMAESGFNDARMTIQTGGNERVASGPRQDNSVPVLITAVYNADQNLQQFYINGVLAGTDSTTIDLNNISDDLNVLGRGFYGDPNPNCAIDEFRIWNGPLTPQQVAANFALGPNSVSTNAGGAFLGLSSVSVPSTTMVGNSSQQATALAVFANATNALNSDVTNWVSSNPSVLTVSSSGLVQSVGPIGSATISATAFGSTATSALISVSSAQPTISQDLVPLTKFVGSPAALSFGANGGNLHYSWYRNSTLLSSQTNSTLNIAAVALSDDANYSVTASNAVGTVSSSTVHLTVLQQALTHRYSMDDATVTDSIGGANGTPVNNVTFSGGQAFLPGTQPSGPASDYISLPANLITGYNSVTFECWATIVNNSPGFHWLVGFGDYTSLNDWLIVVPDSGSDARMTIKTLGSERVAGGAPKLDTGVPVHIAAVYDADQNQMRLYANGVLLTSAFTTIDLANVNDSVSWIGRSFFGDPSVQGSIDEFRIWNGPLTPEQIAANDSFGPNVVTTNAGGAYLGLTSVSVANPSMLISVSQQATALGSFANEANVSFNSQVTNWVSSNPGVATVSGTGLITAVGAGSSTISATAFGSTASVGITVSSATIQLTHSGSVLHLTWPIGQLQQTTNLVSPWTVVIGAVSPYSVTNTGAPKIFYRVQVQ